MNYSKLRKYINRHEIYADAAAVFAPPNEDAHGGCRCYTSYQYISTSKPIYLSILTCSHRILGAIFSLVQIPRAI